MLVASACPLSCDLLQSVREPSTKPDVWAIQYSPAALAHRTSNMLVRLRRFTSRPWRDKREILYRRWTRLFPS